MNKKIATLITSYNRKDKTLSCLKALFNCDLPARYKIEVFLVDDGSIDGTGNAVKEKSPQVNIIQGTGNLFWNRGMGLAWQKASEACDYDFYLWLNDDTLLDKGALTELLSCYDEALQKEGLSIIVGSCRISNKQNVFSYGGRNEKGPVIPNGELQRCTYMNGNVVLVSKEVFYKVGNLSVEFTHTLGDIDYGLRAIKAGINCFVSKTYLATCPPNEGVQVWCNPKAPLKKRWKHLYSPKGLNVKEYILFRKKHWGNKWIIFALKAYLKTIIPSLYGRISKSK